MKLLCNIYVQEMRTAKIMADNKEEQRKRDSQEYEFVKERIVQKPKKRGAFIGKIFGAVILGLIFGGMGAVSFTLVLPYAQELFKGEEEPTSENNNKIVIPKDDETTSQEQNSTEQQGSEENPTTEQQEQQPPAGLSYDEILALIQKELESVKPDINDYEELYKNMFSVVSKADNSIVTVTSVKNNTDIWDNPYEAAENTSGIIYNITENEVFILTDWESIKDADFIKVSFLNGFSCNASVRMYDRSSNMAVICIDVVLFDEYLFNRLEAVPLGNSNVVKQGDPVIAIGNPMGYMHTMSYGIVTTVKNTMQSVDAVYRLIDTNVIKSNSGNGFLINLKGELIGLITNSYNDYMGSSDSNVLTALAISDLKGRLEIISNNSEVAYLGIIGRDITSDIAASQNLPQGIYISQTIIDSPVYAAGIRSGDIIVSVDAKTNVSMKTLRNYIEGKSVQDTVIIAVKRKSRDEYTEISFEITLGAYK